MSQTLAKSPGTMTNTAVGGSYFSWTNPNNAKVSDDAFVTSSLDLTPIVDLKISLIKADGTYGSQNKQIAGQWPITADTYYSYGGSSDVWEETLTAEDINDPDFGVVVQVGQDPTQINAYSDDLKATNFGFSIPTGAKIDGILVEIERNYVDVGKPKTPQIDHIRIIVYYTGATGNFFQLF